jgi:hypothetical protein
MTHPVAVEFGLVPLVALRVGHRMENRREARVPLEIPDQDVVAVHVGPVGRSVVIEEA